MFKRYLLGACLAGCFAASSAALAADQPHNIVLFVADGLRARMVDDQTAPTMAALARGGVRCFATGHSLFPTFTTANASAMATGHYLGDTGDFSNTIYTGFPVPGAGNSLTPFLESDPVLGDVDEHFAGNYLNEDTILQLAREKGYCTASVGKLGPALIFDHTARTGLTTIVIDDATGTPKGIPLSPVVTARLTAVGLPLVTPLRGANAKAGDAKTPGTLTANVVQQDYFASAATRAVLPLLADKHKPFIMVFWSRDPDGSQHNQGDSLLKLVPGINGPTSLAAIRNADDDLERLTATLDELGLADTTDVIVIADHGFSTISKQSASSAAAQQQWRRCALLGCSPSGSSPSISPRRSALPLADPEVSSKPPSRTAPIQRMAMG